MNPPLGEFRIWSNIHQKWMTRAGTFTARVELAGRFSSREAIHIYRAAAIGWDPFRPFDIAVTLVPV